MQIVQAAKINDVKLYTSIHCGSYAFCGLPHTCTITAIARKRHNDDTQSERYNCFAITDENKIAHVSVPMMLRNSQSTASFS